VTFGGQVHDGIWLMLFQHQIDFNAVANIDLFNSIAAVAARLGQAVEVAGLDEFVEVNHFIPNVLNNVADDG
jgi:hypothetical protein